MSQDCPVCYEAIQGDAIRPLECGHVICVTCSFKINPPRCPLCRSSFHNDYRDSSGESEDTLHIMSVSDPIDIPYYGNEDYNDPDDFIVSTSNPRRRRRRQRTIVGSAPDVLLTAAPLPISPEEAETILAELMGTRNPARRKDEKHSTSDKTKQARRNNRNRWRDSNMIHGTDE